MSNDPITNLTEPLNALAKEEGSFEPGRGYSPEDWEAVDSPEATDEQLGCAKPFAEAFPQLAENFKRGRNHSEKP
ncbi:MULTISPECIES: hypothetical protein [Haematobacter]|uniref:Uncharacterized protein n=1 Tax=Haematobacter genomosp. 1 TaxID=366618 RepID=A0A212ABY7_9RHOB|nr:MULTISPECIES: hypothetical protein [Haematobacter]OWJ78400.1 hypothetical protein CDV49_08155 [Haematobacter genomosp. 1]